MQVYNEIAKLNTVYENVRVDCYCIMPDHIHMIIVILPPEESFGNIDGRRSIYASVVAPTSKCSPSLSRIIQQFKGAVSKKIGTSIWQKLFYDEIIRNRRHYLAARRYIADNPLRWEADHGDPGDFDAFLTPVTE